MNCEDSYLEVIFDPPHISPQRLIRLLSPLLSSQKTFLGLSIGTVDQHCFVDSIWGTFFTHRQKPSSLIHTL